jgi:hypothetical protein
MISAHIAQNPLAGKVLKYARRLLVKVCKTRVLSVSIGAVQCRASSAAHMLAQPAKHQHLQLGNFTMGKVR